MIQQSIRSLDGKIAEVLGRQERIVSLLATQPGNQNQASSNAQLNIDTIRREEVNNLMNQQGELVRTIRDI